MTLANIIAVCDEHEAAGLKHAALVVPRGVSLRGFPRGELLCDNAERGRVYRFPTAKLRALVARAAADGMAK